MNRSTKTALLIIAIPLLFVSTFVGIIIFTQRNEEELLPVDNFSQEEWDRKIETTTRGSLVTATNTYDGYSITVPSRWEIPIGTHGKSMKIYYHPDGYTIGGIDTPEGLILSITLHENPSKLSPLEWLAQEKNIDSAIKTTLNSYEAYKTTDQLFDIDRTTLEVIPVPNSEIVAYYIARGSTIYILECFSVEPRYQQLIAECEDHLSSFSVNS